MKDERAQFSGSRLNSEGGTPASPIKDKEKSVERQARAQNEDLGYCSMNMLIRLIATLVMLTITLSVSATSWHDDSHYVALGPRTGYYIVQATPNQFYIHRLGSFIRGQSRLPDAKAFFGQPQSIEHRSDGFIAYYAIQVYNPFEDLGGGRK